MVKISLLAPVVASAMVAQASALNFAGIFGKTSMPRGGQVDKATSINGGGTAKGTDDEVTPLRREIVTDIESGRALARKNKDIDHIFNANQAWRMKLTAKDEDVFSRAVGNHKPSFLWIGCSDARVPANEILGESPGNVFVHRNIANQVLNTDMNVMSVIQYAVDYLKVPHIIVCGHYDCGGVRAASSNMNHYSPLENWLRNIRDVRRVYAEQLEAISDPEARHRRLVELNVKEQCLSIFKTAVVQRRLVETHGNSEYGFSQPRIHAMVYDPASGELVRLQVNFSALMDELSTIYDVYRKDKATA